MTGTHCNSGRVLLTVLLVLVSTALCGEALARIITTKQVGSRALDGLVIGTGFEYQPDPQNPEYVAPITVEYNFTDRLKLGVEVDYGWVTCVKQPKPGRKCGAATGVTDLETGMEWEVVPERRWRPSLALLYTVKLPTKRPFGSGYTDVDAGIIVSKEFVHFNVDANAIYGFVGTPAGKPSQGFVELSTSTEYHINHVWDFQAEFVYDSSGGAAGGRFSGNNGGGNGPQTQFTVGLAQHLNHYIRLEEGYTHVSDGTELALFGIEYDFGGSK